jgi:carboxyl-terminal processing protease
VRRSLFCASIAFWVAFGSITVASPASDLIAQVDQSIRHYYWNPGLLDLSGVRARLQRGLDQNCANTPFCPTNRVYDTIRAVVRDLPDKHSSFRTPNELKAIRTDQAGDPTKDDRFGLGLEVRRSNPTTNMVWRVLAGSPADRAGVRVGDVILETVRAGKATPYRDLRLPDASVVTLRVDRRGERLELMVTPEAGMQTALLLPEATSLQNGVGYVRVPSFRATGTAQRAHALLEKLISDGLRALVLDLRFNTGGYLDEAALLAAALTDGPLLTLKSRNASIPYTINAGVLEYPTGLSFHRVALEHPVRFVGNVVILTNTSTSSAAELLAAVLQHAGAKVIGEHTYGLADTAVLPLALNDGSELRLAAVRNFYPDDTPIPPRLEPNQFVRDDLNAIIQGHDQVLESAVASLVPKIVMGLSLAPSLGLEFKPTI